MYWDEELGLKRRYRKSSLVKMLQNAGFKVLNAHYFYSFLLPIAILFRASKSVAQSRHSDFVKIPGLFNTALLAACFLERQMSKFLPVPAGLSVFIIAQK